MPKLPPGFAAVSKEHLARLERLIALVGVRPLRKLYEQAHDELELKLGRMVGKARNTFTAHQHAAMLAQVRQGEMEIAQRLARRLNSSSVDVQRGSIKDLVSYIGRLEKMHKGAATPLPIEQAARLSGVIDKRKSSLLHLHKTSMAKYGARTVKTMEKGLAQSLIQGESAMDAIERVRQAADLEWWQAERIVRTELAFASSAAAADGMQDSLTEMPNLMMRWTEYVSDTTKAPLDDRVAVDSLAMHGQLARPGGLFTMPPDPRVSPKVWGRSWAFPPNRPNDRAVIQPWQPDWGVPGWVLKGGRRVPIGKRGGRF